MEGLQETTTLYRAVATIPTIKSGSVYAAEDGSSVHVSWVSEVMDFENNTKIAMERRALVTQRAGGTSSSVLPVPGAPSILDAKSTGFTSPSGNVRLVVGPNGSGEELALSIFNSTGFVKRIAVDKKHGAIFPSSFFQNVCWSQDESRVLYVAERTVAPAPKVWAKGACEAGAPPCSAFETKQSFGEALRDFYHLSIFITDISTGSIREVVPVEFSSSRWLSNPIFVHGDQSVWFVASDYFPEKLGLAHCATRPNQLYEVALPAADSSAAASTPTAIPYPDGVSCTRNIRVRGTRTVCVVPATGCKAHSCTYALWSIDTQTKQFRCVLPIPVQPDASADRLCPSTFYGLYSCTGSDIYWMTDDIVLFQTPRRSSCVVFEINLATGERQLIAPLSTTPLADIGNWTVLDVCNEAVLLAHSTTLDAPRLYLWNRKTSPSGTLLTIDDSARQKQRELFPDSAFETKLVSLGAAHHDTDVLVHRRQGNHPPLATILFVHGGPHSSDSNAYATNLYFQLLAGFDIISVNYGGSVGFGQQRIDDLLGHIGDHDVSDCMAALEAVGPVGPLVVSGGSHGGFLAAHLSGRFPDRFRVAILRNPVINIASNYWETDISDWCLAEAGVVEPDVQAFYACSPIQYAARVKAATLIGIGLDDMRVPPPQGRSWFYAIRRYQSDVNGTSRVPVRMLEYPGTGHAMDSPQSTIDFQVHAAMFVKQHVH